MRMSPISVVPACCFMLIAAFTASAADDTAPFGSKIDAWMEGSIISLDSASGKFTVHGAKRPYATQFAKMQKEINSKTEKLTGADRDAKIASIKASWADTLEKARTEERAKGSDFNFKIPGKDGLALSYDEKSDATVLSNDKTGMKALSDFSIGQYVLVGYDAGVVSNDAYVIAITTKPAMVPVDAQFKDKSADGKTTIGLDPATEEARQIRKSLQDDASLSTAAHNVNIEVKGGIAHLRGTVPSESEKLTVESKAGAVVGKDKVMSHLEVSK